MEKEIQEINSLKKQIQSLQKNISTKERLIVLKLRSYKKENGLSSRELARKLFISPSYLSDIELGRRKMSVGFLEKVININKKGIC